MASTHYTVNRSFLVNIDGVDVLYEKGEVVDAGDPVLKGHADHFEPLIVKARASASKVEKATAAPGEKR